MSSAWDLTFEVRPPRAVFVNFPLNHQTGKANEPALGRRILLDALRAFETLWAPGQMLTLPYVWDAGDRAWEATDWGPDFESYGSTGTSLQGTPERVLNRSASSDRA